MWHTEGQVQYFFVLLVNNNNMLLVNFSILTVFYWEKNKEEKQDNIQEKNNFSRVAHFGQKIDDRQGKG